MTPAALRQCAFFRDIISKEGEVYLVGGCVRDELMGRPLKDLDLLVRKLDPDRLTDILKNYGRVNLVGRHFGVIKFRPRETLDTELDIALPRKEVSTGSGHRDFDVHYDCDLPVEDDLKRRDFTINAMAENAADGRVIDPFNGREDLRCKLIRAVFDDSFREDPLRLMRAVQFSARFGFTIETNTFAQMRRDAPLIRTVARERIVDEIGKLFTAPKPSVGFELMRDTGLLAIVFPDIENMIGVTQPNKGFEDVYSHTMKVLDAARSAEELEKSGDLDIMFSALFHDAGKPKTKRETEDETKRVTFFNHQLVSTGIVKRWLKDFRAATIGVDPARVAHLVRHHMFETKEFHNERALRRFVNKVGKDNVFDLLDLRLADKKGGRFPKKVYGILQLRERIREQINRKAPFCAKDLAVTGHDIIALGYKPGPVIGRIQKFLVEKVLDEPELNVKESLVRIIGENRETFAAPETRTRCCQ